MPRHRRTQPTEPPEPIEASAPSEPHESDGSTTPPDPGKVEAILAELRAEWRPNEPRDPDQAWFWTPRWQQMEREADEAYAAGRYKTFDDVESFLADLEAGVDEERP